MPTAVEKGNLNSTSNDLAGSGWNETPGRLILAQIDHLSGEEVGGLIEALQEAGVSGLQVSPTVTKKNRPGQIVLIDLGRGDHTDQTTEILAAYGLSGFHLVETRHFHLPQTRTSYRVTIRQGDQKITAEIGIKRLCRPRKPEILRIEFDDLKHLCQQIQREFGFSIAPPDLNRQLTAQLLKGSEAVINLDRQVKKDGSSPKELEPFKRVSS